MLWKQPESANNNIIVMCTKVENELYRLNTQGEMKQKTD
jgi:hypothetical protein